MCWEAQQARAAFLNHFANVGVPVNQGIVEDEHGFGERPFVHVREQALNKSPEVVPSDRLVKDFEVQNPIKGHGGEHRVFRFAKYEIVAAGAFATQ